MTKDEQKRENTQPPSSAEKTGDERDRDAEREAWDIIDSLNRGTDAR